MTGGGGGDLKDLDIIIKCKQETHRNLLRYKTLPTILRKILNISESVCQICLDTAFEYPSKYCKEYISNRRYKTYFRDIK